MALNPSGDGLFDALRYTTVTRCDVYAAIPFDENVLIADLTGDGGGGSGEDAP